MNILRARTNFVNDSGVARRSNLAIFRNSPTACFFGSLIDPPTAPPESLPPLGACSVLFAKTPEGLSIACFCDGVQLVVLLSF